MLCHNPRRGGLGLSATDTRDVDGLTSHGRPVGQMPAPDNTRSLGATQKDTPAARWRERGGTFLEARTREYARLRRNGIDERRALGIALEWTFDNGPLIPRFQLLRNMRAQGALENQARIVLGLLDEGTEASLREARRRVRKHLIP